jgi:hypothetical protein
MVLAVTATVAGVGAWLLTRPARRAADDGALVNGLVLLLGLCGVGHFCGIR